MLPSIIEHPALLQSLQRYFDTRLFEMKDVTGENKRIHTFDRNKIQENLRARLTQLTQVSNVIPTVQTEMQSLINNQSHVGNNDVNDEVNLEVQFLDMPLSLAQLKRVMSALSSVQEYENILGSKAIQMIINYRWADFKPRIMIPLFTIYAVLLTAFVAYSNLFTPETRESWLWYGLEMALGTVVVGLCGFFLSWEVIQMKQLGWAYFTQSKFWNFVDILPSVLAIIVVVFRTFLPFGSFAVMSSVHSLASLLLWIKVLYFMRIFKATGFYIQIIMGSFLGMKEFLLILLVVQLGFGEAFLRLSESSQGAGNFLGGFGQAFIYAFRMGLGDNDTDPYAEVSQPIFAWTLFLACSVFTTIVMLNILISVIGQSYEAINSQAELASYKERVDLIDENDVFQSKQFSFYKRFGGGQLEEEERPAAEVMNQTNWLTVFRKVAGGADEEPEGEQAIEEMRGEIQELRGQMGALVDSVQDIQKLLAKMEKQRK